MVCLRVLGFGRLVLCVPVVDTTSFGPVRIGLEMYGNLPYRSVMSDVNQPANSRLEARVPAEVHALLKRAADLEGRTLTDFVVAAASAAARKAIEDAEMIRLSAQDQQRFADVLIDPPKVSPAMKRALNRHRKLIEPAE